MGNLRKRALTIQLEEKRPSEMLAALHKHTKDMKVEEEVLPSDLPHSLGLCEKYQCPNQEAFEADVILGRCKGIDSTIVW